MHSRVLFGERADPERQYAFSARDRIDETVIRQRSVFDGRYHYVRNFTPQVGFSTLNRYKEKCFLVQPLIRRLQQQGALDAVTAEFLKPFPPEGLFDPVADPDEIHNLVDSVELEHVAALQRLRAALDTWMVETGDRGHWPEPPSVVKPFTQEMHDWFGTPDWERWSVDGRMRDGQR
jgi:N-sulfoglucosamine sulfohydrolase